MKQLIPILYFLIFIFSVSCEENRTDKSSSHLLSYLSGYWVPKQIKWEIEDPRYKDSGRMFETAHFRTLIFNTPNKFIYFGSTQRHQNIGNDSLIFAGEPLFTVFAGTWKALKDTVLQVDYKPLEYNINPPDTRERNERIKIIFQEDTLLFFENQLYRRTDKYDAISVEAIEGYKKEYLK